MTTRRRRRLTPHQPPSPEVPARLGDTRRLRRTRGHRPCVRRRVCPPPTATPSLTGARRRPGRRRGRPGPRTGSCGSPSSARTLRCRRSPSCIAPSSTRAMTPTKTRLTTICTVVTMRVGSLVGTMSPKPTVANTVTTKYSASIRDNGWGCSCRAGSAQEVVRGREQDRYSGRVVATASMARSRGWPAATICSTCHTTSTPTSSRPPISHRYDAGWSGRNGSRK